MPRKSSQPGWVRALLLCAAVAATAGATLALAAAPDANSAASLRAVRESISASLSQNPYQRPIFLESAETGNGLKGDVYAEIDYPFEAVDKALNGPAHWCEVMLLHLNTKQCRLTRDKTDTNLALGVVRKYDQPLEQAFRLVFAYRVVATAPDYLEVVLTSAQGPLGTSNYRIVLQATSLPGGRSFLHFTYSYDSNAIARLATQAYLATFGRGKVGFAVVGRLPDGQPDHIRGMRGLVERNAMRYFLAIDAYLGAMAVAPSERFEKRLDNWFTAVERYPRQLHEVDRATYLDLKRSDQLQKPAAERMSTRIVSSTFPTSQVVVPMASPSRTGRVGAQSAAKVTTFCGNSMTTVEPSRKRPISAPLASTMFWPS